METVTTVTGGEVSGGGGSTDGYAVLLGMVILTIGADIHGGGGSMDGSLMVFCEIVIHTIKRENLR